MTNKEVVLYEGNKVIISQYVFLVPNLVRQGILEANQKFSGGCGVCEPE